MTYEDRIKFIADGIEHNPEDVVKCLREIFIDEHLTPKFFEGLINSNDYYAVSPGCKAAIEIILAVANSEDRRHE